MISSDSIRGHLDPIILRLILEKDRYGYEVSREISLRTLDRFQIKEATLYAVFQRLEKKGYITSYEGDISLGSRRRYYSITKLGRACFHEEVEQWNQVKDIIDLFMRTEETEEHP